MLGPHLPQIGQINLPFPHRWDTRDSGGADRAPFLTRCPSVASVRPIRGGDLGGLGGRSGRKRPGRF